MNINDWIIDGTNGNIFPNLQGDYLLRVGNVQRFFRVNANQPSWFLDVIAPYVLIFGGANVAQYMIGNFIGELFWPYADKKLTKAFPTIEDKMKHIDRLTQPMTTSFLSALILFVMNDFSVSAKGLYQALLGGALSNVALQIITHPFL